MEGVYSGDGNNWDVASASDGTWDNAQLHQVTAYHDGFVVVGNILDVGDTDTVLGAAWISDDGTDWRLVDDSLFDVGDAVGVCEGSGYAHGGLNQVAVVDGRILALGTQVTETRRCRWRTEAVARTSLDGLTWEDAAVPASVERDLYEPRLIGGDQFVLIGSDHVTISRSSDGANWTDTTLEAPPDARANILVGLGEGYVALGSSYEGGDVSGTYTQLVWSSTDGASWILVSEQQLEADVLPVTSVTSIGNTIVGTRGVGRLPGEVESIWGVAVSDDGVAWSNFDTGPFDRATLYDLYNDGDSVLLTGESQDTGELMMWVAELP